MRILLIFRIRQLETELESNRGTVSQMGAKIENLEELKQAQADEYSALALSCTQFEDRLLKSEDENRHLLQQLVKVKQQLADHLNTQNEEVIELVMFPSYVWWTKIYRPSSWNQLVWFQPWKPNRIFCCPLPTKSRYYSPRNCSPHFVCLVFTWKTLPLFF